MDIDLRALLAPWLDLDDPEVRSVLQELVEEVIAPPLLAGERALDRVLSDVVEAAEDGGGPLARAVRAPDVAEGLVLSAWAALHRRAQAWEDDETDPDRLEGALDLLDAAGVRTGWFTDAASVEPLDGDHGVALTSYRDLERLDLDEEVVVRVEFGGLGATDDGLVGHEVIAALRERGLDPAWDGDPGRAVTVALRWRPHIAPHPDR